MIAKNDNVRDYLGVTAWHNAGYLGSRVTVANGETWSLAKYNPDGLCTAPIAPDTDNSHGEDTARVLHEIAPRAKIVQLPFGSTRYAETAYRYILDNDICIMTRSMAVNTTSLADAYLPDLPNTTYFNCAGNDGDDDYAKIIKSKYVNGVGAVYLDAKNKITPAHYSSESEFVDYCGMTNVYTSDHAKFTGTSCATPALAGLAALVQDLFIAKTGHPLDRVRLHVFLMDCCHDLGDDGHDDDTGWGVVVLPPPETVDVWQWQNKKYLEDSMDIKKFVDYGDIADYQRGAVQCCVSNSIMEGDDDGKFRPNDAITRGDLAVVIDRLMQKMEG